MFRPSLRRCFVPARYSRKAFSTTCLRFEEFKNPAAFTATEQTAPSGEENTHRQPLLAAYLSENPVLDEIYDIAKQHERKTEQARKELAETSQLAAALAPAPTAPTQSGTDAELTPPALTTRSASVRVLSLPPEMTEEDLGEMFDEYGVSDLRIDTLRGDRIATVTFTTPDAADRVADQHQRERFTFNNKRLFIRFGSTTRLKEPSKTIFVGNVDLSNNDVEEFLRHLFQPLAPVVSCRIARSVNACFVTFSTIEDAKKIVEQHEFRPFREGRQILRLNYEEPRKVFEQPNHTLCITGFDGEPEELEEYFPAYDGHKHILNVHALPDSTQSGRLPLCFVRFSDVAYATQALETLRESPDVPFKVTFARTRRDNTRERDSRPRY